MRWRRLSRWRMVTLTLAAFIGVPAVVIDTISRFRLIESWLAPSLGRYLPVAYLASFVVGLAVLATAPDESTPDGVLYREYMKLREAHGKQAEQLASEKERGDQLVARAEQLAAEIAKSKPRAFDRLEMLAATNVLLENTGPDLRKHAIYIYPVPTVHDSAIVANRLKEALEFIDLHPQMRDEGPDRRDFPLLEFGTWVIGDSQRLAERWLGKWLETIGLQAHVADMQSRAMSSPHYSGVEIWITVGDSSGGDVMALHLALTRYDRTPQP